ncbi:S1/P1 nuclease [Mucilaginibacter aquatilis]|uniref:S1/P1 Nuclease n=1 Tax=Mucilaginibacter aquatilis TaxID=1517760 RepID=A0A6I4IQP9_9SPHI|nr:S1/P1 nuclease [Mucilaginibacter aquatilis]MVN91524.1 hypothetical protein [Mucilaginibacter aquatilis]
MKKYLFIVLALSGAVGLISWGFKGHRAVATIAQRHLTSNTAYVVSAYLGGQPMDAVSTWADENRDPKTAAWHYINLPLGLNREQFVKTVQESEGTVYTAILKMEATLKDPAASVAQKNEALKYLIHFVGDAHQPMHVSRKEDKGGNTIQLRLNGKGTNLHSLWDSKLIDQEGLSQDDMVRTYDKATPAEIKKWQNDSPMEWLWESYQVTSELYANAKPGQTIDDAYYQKYIPVIRKRVDQAGIRLAGELNKLFNNANAPARSDKADKSNMLKNNATKGIAVGPVDINDVAKYIGKTIYVTAKAYSAKDIGSMVLVNLGAAYPDQLLTLALKGDAKALGAQLEGKMITVSGEVIDFKGKPEIIVTKPEQITVK